MISDPQKPRRVATANQQWINGCGSAHKSLRDWKAFKDSQPVVVFLMLQAVWISHRSRQCQSSKDVTASYVCVKSADVRNARSPVCEAESCTNVDSGAIDLLGNISIAPP